MATLRTFCQGDVCAEIILMACDGGLIEQEEKVITGALADTTVVAVAAPGTKLPDLGIREIICKPL